MPRSTREIPGREIQRRAGAADRPDPAASDARGDRRLARLEADVLGPARAAGEAEARLRLLVSSYTVLAVDDPQVMTLLSEIGGESAGEPRPAAVRERVDRFVDLLESDLAEIFERRGRASEVDPGVAARSLLGIIHWGIRSHRAEQRLSRDQAIRQVTFLALHGLCPA